MLNRRSALCFLALSLCFIAVSAQRLVYSTSDLNNAKVDAAGWTMSPGGYQKFDICESQGGASILGGMINGPHIIPIIPIYGQGPRIKPTYTKVFSIPQRHYMVKIKFQVWSLRSTDGCPSDYYRVRVDDQVAYSECAPNSHGNHGGNCHNYIGWFGGWGGTDWIRLQREFEFPHTSGNIKITFSDEVDETLENEAYGWSNLVIEAYDGPATCLTSNGPNSCATCDPTATKVMSGSNGVCSCKAGLLTQNTSPLTCKGNCPSCGACTNFNLPNMCTACPLHSWPPEAGTNICTCNDGFYPAAYSPLVCSTCHSSCAKCNGGSATQCTACRANMIRNAQGQCVCAPGTYATSTAPLNCAPCHASCDSCSGPAATQCLTCKVVACPGCGPLKLIPGLGCIHCDPSCADCGVNAADCIRCSASALVVGAQPNRRCSCAVGYYPTPNIKPTACSRCDHCTACAADGSCSACTSLATLVHNGNSGSCVCPAGTFKTSDTPVTCVKCHASCVTCNGANANQCLSCPVDTILSAGSCVHCDASCVHCNGVGDTHCTACAANAHLVAVAGGAKCVCNDGWYGVITAGHLVCQKCDSSCQTCNGPANNQCTSCSNAGVLTYQAGKATCQCHDGFYIKAVQPQLTCAACPANCQHCTANAQGALTCTACNTGFKLGGGACFVCDKSCHDCSGPANSQCTACDANAELVGGKCHCKANFYSETQSPLALNCQPYKCDPTCKTCNGPHRTQCLSCIDQHWLHQADGSCKQIKCHENCLDCNGEGEFACTVCKPGAELHNAGGKNQCQCKVGYFTAVASPLTCTQCDRSCVTCTAAGAHCATCPANAHSVNGACVCLDGFHDDGHNPMGCLKCPAGCTTCDKDGKCLTCPAGPTGSHSRVINGACVNCSTVCADCNAVGDNRCTACTTGAGLVDSVGGKTCACSAGHFATAKAPLTCGTCNAACAECGGAADTSCTKCTEGALLTTVKSSVNPALNGTTCKCADGYFASSTSPLKCTKCHPSCHTCTGASDGQCSSCVAPLNLDTTNHRCILCDLSCTTCDGVGNNHCTGCPSNALLDTATRTCHCKPGFVASNAAGHPLTCSPCSQQCVECSGTGADTCTKCATNSHLTAVGTTGHSCKCDDGFFASTLTPLTCSKCDASCLTCGGVKSNDCLTCKAGHKWIGGKCITCSDTCADCDGEGENHCTKCTAGADLVKNLLGITCACKAGFAPTSSHPLRCEAYTCHASCSQCKGPKDSDCTSCPPDHDLVNGICKVRTCHSSCIKCDKASDPHSCSSCTTGAALKSDKSCACQDGYFQQLADPLTCHKCDPSCTTCNGEGAAKCTGCVANSNLKDSACHCNDGFWANKANNGFVCSPCNSLCHTCNGANSDNCLSCPANKTLFAARCITCNANCKECNGETANRCTACADNAELVVSGDGHVCACKAGFWSATTAPLNCQPYKCDASCVTCHGPHTDHCDSCHDGFKLVSHQCVAVKCDANCITCDPDHPTTCKTCTTGATLNPSTHKCECSAGYAVASTSPLKCDKITCHETCTTCVGTGAGDCTACIANADVHLTSGKGTCTCKDGFFQNRNHCEACDKSCKTCKGSNHNECTACTDPKAKLISGSCIVCDKSCADCHDATIDGCTACTAPHVLTVSKNGKQCLCPPGYSGDKCDQYTCDAICDGCTGPGANHCKACHDKTLVLENGTCKKPDCDKTCADCAGPRAADCTRCGSHQDLIKSDATKGTCQCAAGFYNHGAAGKTLDCQPCDASCKTCTGAGNKACVTCLVGAHLDNATKSCSCQDGTFLQTQNPFHCSTCDKSCKTCKGATAHDCVTCHTGEELVNGTCIKCDAKCKTCTDVGSHCATCDASAHLVDVPASGNNKAGKTCVCPDGFFAKGDAIPLTCSKCDAACKTCNGDGAHHCIVCAAANSALLTKSDGTHECGCTAGHYAKSTSPLVCESYTCDKSCATCHGPGDKNCTTCPKGSSFHEGKCTAFNCSAGCKDCTGPSAHECTACNANFDLTTVTGGKGCSCSKGYQASTKKPGTCERIKCAENSCDKCHSEKPNTCFECERGAVLKENGSCECQPPNIVWNEDPYICSDTYIEYVEAAEDEDKP